MQEMHLHLLYLWLGLADWLVLRFRTPSAEELKGLTGEAALARPSLFRSAWALLVVLASVLLTAIVAPSLVPAVAGGLIFAGDQALLWFAALALLAIALRWLSGVARFLRTCHRNGKAIHIGDRRPAWR